MIIDNDDFINQIRIFNFFCKNIFLKNLEKEKNGDIFGNKPVQTSETEEEDDMSWLADLI